MEAAIRFENVSKRFSLHQNRPRSLQELALSLLRRGGNDQRKPFHALDDVSFEIPKGKTVGFIGPNGAGKSTALKLIARILEPTSGEITINGQVRALLELGAGFHPDLTGRDNVFLNGSILGLSRAEVRQKLDQIIEFAEIGQFIDVPVKHYSSGMHVRLGFSVAVHTDPEILLVDEVLAVGDATFQQKCLERIAELRHRGVTIVYVSHALDSVRELCSRAFWLEAGQIQARGSATSVVRQYEVEMLRRAHESIALHEVKKEDIQGPRVVEITRVRLLNGDHEEQLAFQPGDTFIVEMDYVAHERVRKPVFGVGIHRADGLHITGPNTQFAGYDIPWVEGEGMVRYRLDALPLLEGRYTLSVAAHNWDDTRMFDYHDQAYPFRIFPVDSGERYGLVSLGGQWDHEAATERPAQPDPQETDPHAA